ncbi:MAG: ThuA domain-containing protein [Bacteroidales bacterium]|nr:ThuA domain-containing protein [Bacteroidales bacterium]
MKKILTLSIILLSAVVQAQPQGNYLPSEQMPTPQLFLPGPPSLQDPLFFNDWVAYQQGKELRGTERGYRAIDDADTGVSYFMMRFGEAMGVRMTPETCPKIARYMSMAFNTAKQSNSKAKDYYARVRPYNQFKEDTPTKWSQNPKDNTSYPSGHSCRAWAAAMALAAIDPDHQDEIFKVGYDYGQSRVILGFHYQSDIEAARLVASAGMARLMGEKSFQEDMAEARAELENLRATTPPLIRTVIVTGQDNHNWEVSSIAIARTLRYSGLFSVDIAYSPSQGGDMALFNVDFKDYDLVVMDYNGDEWNPEMKAAFLEFVNDGGGVVVYHSSDNAFPAWKEYNEITALGGWNDRSLKEGAYAYWDGSKLVKDKRAGVAGSHGRQHEYVMNVRNDAHPVTAGLPAQWKHAKDELYDRMRGPANIGDLLFTAYSSSETGGSGREEPLIFTVSYGKARIFHIMIGHAGASVEDNPAMQCVGFQTLLLRGAEWSAIGTVTQEVPDDFPTADEVSLRPEYRKKRIFRMPAGYSPKTRQ